MGQGAGVEGVPASAGADGLGMVRRVVVLVRRYRRMHYDTRGVSSSANGLWRYQEQGGSGKETGF